MPTPGPPCGSLRILPPLADLPIFVDMRGLPGLIWRKTPKRHGKRQQCRPSQRCHDVKRGEIERIQPLQPLLQLV